MYKKAYPQSQKASYIENENVEFRLNFPDASLRRGSVRLSGVLSVNNPANNTMIDAPCGCDALFQNITTEFNGVVVENLLNAPRLVKMKVMATQDDGQMLSSNITGMRCARDKQTTTLLAGEKTLQKYPFTIRLNSVVNRTDRDVPYSKTGEVRINVRTSPNNDFLQNGSSYTLSNLEMNYEVSEGGESKSPVRAITYHYIKHNVNSSRMSIQTAVPAVCNGVSCSFILSSKEHTQADNKFRNVFTA